MARTSVVIPTHDRPVLLRRAVESARLAGSDLEIVVVDDGSTDETTAVCASLPDIVHVRLDRRLGVGHARARGIAASTGKYVSFLDDDDARLPGSIDRQVELLERAPETGLAYGQIRFASQSLAVDERRPVPANCPTGDVFWKLIAGNFIPSGSVVARKQVIEDVGGLEPEAAPADDWDLWLRIAERRPIAALPEAVAIYREPTLWSNQGSSRIVGGLLEADFRVLERCAKLPRAVNDPRAFGRSARMLRRSLCDRLLAESFYAARQRDAYALISLQRALLATPAALLQAMFSFRTWTKLRERLRS